MCGIVYTNGKNTAARTLAQYKKQATRGREGFGFLAIHKHCIVKHRRSEKEITKLLNTQEIVYHHRFPTSTPNFQECAHPIPMYHKDWKSNYFIAHNGVVSPYNHMDAATKKGYRFTTMLTTEKITRTARGKEEKDSYVTINDSEMLGFNFAQLLEGKVKTVYVTGSMAVILIQQDKMTGKTRTYAYRNDANPLKMHVTADGLMLSSEGEGHNIDPYRLYEVKGNVLEDTHLVTPPAPKKDVVPYKESMGYRTSSKYTEGYYDKYHGYDDDEYEIQLSNEIKKENAMTPLPLPQNTDEAIEKALYSKEIKDMTQEWEWIALMMDNDPEKAHEVAVGKGYDDAQQYVTHLEEKLDTMEGILASMV